MSWSEKIKSVSNHYGLHLMVCYNRFVNLLDSKARCIRKFSVELFRTPVLQMSSGCCMPSHSWVSWPHCEMWKWSEQNSGMSNTCVGIFVLIMLRQHWVMSRSVRSTLQPAVIKYNAVTVPSNRLKWTRTWRFAGKNHWHNYGVWRNALGTANYSPVIHFPPDAESLSHIGTVCCNSLQCTNTKFNVNNSHTTNIVSRRTNNNDYHCLAMSSLGLHTQPTAGVSLFTAYLPPGGNLLMQRRYFTKAPCKQYAL